jgi:hypothetical protein
MSDPNQKRKHDVLERAKKSGNHKVVRYVQEGLFPKLDQLGAHAGIFLESLEHDWSKFAKPEGLMRGFSDEDFKALHKALYG